jgi:hypothetical protein
MLTWYLIGTATAIGIAWLAAMLHVSDNAPIGIVSVGVGALLGGILGGLAAWLNVHCRKRLLAGAVVLAIVAILAEHAWLYREFRRQWHEARAKSAEVALFRPDSPWSPREYVSRELTAGRALLWACDATLITLSAAVTLLFAQRFVAAAGDTRVASDAAKSEPPTSDL